MTTEARVAFLIAFFTIWCLLGLTAWAAVAVIRHGRGAFLALPLALAGAAAAGVFVPLIGLRDATGFFISLPAALAGGALASIAGAVLSARLQTERPTPRTSVYEHQRER